ncbi:MAG: hypothetical protein ACQEQV_09710 [Fibrobacterota bacterium]
MIQRISLLVLLLLYAAAADGGQSSRMDNTGVSQIYEIMQQLEGSTGAFPPDIERVAVYRIRVDQDHFSRGMARFIRERIEEVFRKSSRREIVTAPELKTIRVSVTDTSFSFSNTVPSIEALWELGDKLRLDAFIDGSCTRTEDGDVLLTLKLLRNTTGEIVWSESFIAGPNEQEDAFPGISFAVGAGASIAPMKEYMIDSNSYTGGNFTSYGMRLYMEEATTARRRFYFSVHGGVYVANLRPEDETQTQNLTVINTKVGGDLIFALLPKDESYTDYWLGILLGLELNKPLMYRRSSLALRHGYRFNVSKHFSIAGGILVNAFDTRMYDTENNHSFELEPLNYEFGLLYNF